LPASNVYSCMSNAAVVRNRTVHQDRQIIQAVAELGPRLQAFVRRQVDDLEDAEDIVQDVFAEFVAAARMMQPIEHVAAWLYRVARNRIVDRFRARARRPTSDPIDAEGEAEPARVLEEWLTSANDGPEAAYARSVLADELMSALEELPYEQQEAFVQHEIEGRSFAAVAAESGVSLGTLLWRKQAAVRHLRQRLEIIHSEFSN